MPLYFNCNTKKCGDYCCTSPNMESRLQLGDVLRISEELGERPADFFIKNGKVSAQLRGPIGSLSLGLQSGPCVLYDKGCSVYESRPVECAIFPYGQLSGKFPSACTVGGKIRPEQRSFLDALDYNVKYEIDLELFHIWKDIPMYFTIDDAVVLLEDASDDVCAHAVMLKDSDINTALSLAVMEDATPRLRQRLADRIDNLKPSTLEAFAKTSKEIRRLYATLKQS